MIEVNRSACPAALQRHVSKWTTALNAAKTSAHKKKAIGKYRHHEIKDALVNMFHGKCAYCESKIRHVDYGDIEHFLPKSGPHKRRDLVFDWENLLLACGVCNCAEWKGDKSPTSSEGGTYVNPCNDDPAVHFRFEYDPVAKIASVRGVTARGAKTEADLGLNRPDLRTYRTKFVQKLMFIAQYADSDPNALCLINEARNATGEYAAFARALL